MKIRFANDLFSSHKQTKRIISSIIRGKNKLYVNGGKIPGIRPAPLITLYRIYRVASETLSTI